MWNRFGCAASEIERAELAALFDGIDIHQAIPVIRAFTHFALLANVAEDIHRERRRAIHIGAGEPPQNSSLAATFLKLDSAELDAVTVVDALTGALVSPVITAHPTETRRRTVFDTQHRITELIRLRLHGHTETADGRDVERELRRHIVTLWQTALIRLSRLKIQDEIETGLRYYPAAFFDVMPRVNAEVRPARRPAGQTRTCWTNRFCGPDRGSAVIATGTRMSPPRWCAWPPDGRPTPRWNITSWKSPRWSGNCRCRRGSSR